MLIAGDGGWMTALVVFGPSLVALDGTEIGEGRRFSKLNRRNSELALIGVSKTGVRALRNSTYEGGGVTDDVLLPSLLDSSRLMGVVAVRGLSSEGNVIVLGVLRGGSTGLFGAMTMTLGRKRERERERWKMYATVRTEEFGEGTVLRGGGG